MRTSHTNIPALVLREPAGAGRVAYLAADLDRRFALDNFPDHGDVLANLTRWAAKDSIPLQVQGSGLLGCELYQQGARLILHVLNFTSAATWRAPIHELIPVGPIQVGVRIPQGQALKSAKTQVAGAPLAATVAAGWISFELKSVLDHELVVIE
jgi:hypothetical protein